MTDTPAFEVLERAVEEARRSGDPGRVAAALCDLAFERVADGSAGYGIHHFLEAADMLAIAGRRSDAVSTLVVAAQVFAMSPEATRLLLRPAASHARMCTPTDAAHGFLNIAALYDALQGWDALDDVFAARAEALRSAQSAADDCLIALSLTYVGKTFIDLYSFDRARQYCEMAAEHLRGARDHPRHSELRAIWHSTLGFAIKEDDPQRAYRHMRASLALYEATGSKSNAARMHRSLTVQDTPREATQVAELTRSPLLACLRAGMLTAIADADGSFEELDDAGASTEVPWTIWANRVSAAIRIELRNYERWIQLVEAARAAGVSAAPSARAAVERAALAAFDAVSRYEDSLAAARAEMALTLQDIGEEYATTARASRLAAIGSIYENLGQPVEAMAAYREAETLLTGDEVNERDSPGLRALIEHGIASVLEDTGQLLESEERYRRSILARDAHALDPDPRPSLPFGVSAELLGESLHNLGNVLADLGRPWEALIAYERSAHVARLAGLTRSVGTAILSRATVLSDLDRDAEAAQLYRDVYELASLSRDQPTAAAACTGLSGVAGEDAIEWLERARGLWVAAGREREVGRVDGRLAGEYRRRNDEPRASEAMRRALAAGAATGDVYGEAKARLARSRQLRVSDEQAADDDLAEALRLARASQDPRILLSALTEFARVALIGGDPSTASQASAEAVALYERARSYRIDRHDRESIAEGFSGLLRLRVSALLAQSRDSTADAGPALVREAFAAAVAVRPRARLEHRQHRATADSAAGRVTAAEARIRAAQVEIFHLQTGRPGPVGPAAVAAEIDTLRQTIDEATRDRDAALGRTATKRPAYGVATTVTVRTEDIQSQLLHDGCLLLYSLDGLRLNIFVVTPTDVQATTVWAGPLLDERVVALRHDLQTASEPWSGDNARALYRMIIEPAETLIHGELPERLLIASDGWLSLVPFAALQTENGAFLGEHHDLTMCPSPAATLVERERDALRGAPMNGDVLAFGDPVAPGVRRIAATAAEASAVVAMFDHGAPAGPDVDDIDPPSMSYDGPAGVCVLRTGAEATKAELMRLVSERSYRFVHLATHARTDSSSARLSGLLLSAPGDDDAPHLTTAEIETQPFDCELCVLSARDSGLGQLSVAEGLVGLARAFAFAGARAVCASLWSVDDQATARLMRRVYQQLAAGETPPSALAAAQRAACTEHPALWAGFVLFV